LVDRANFRCAEWVARMTITRRSNLLPIVDTAQTQMKAELRQRPRKNMRLYVRNLAYDQFVFQTGWQKSLSFRRHWKNCQNKV
jgi:hypothetical protein